MFADKGFERTTTREISAALDITNGTFYHHFDSKQELLFDICAGALSSLSNAVIEQTSAASDPLDALARFVRTHLDVVTSTRDEHVTMLTEMRCLDGERRQRVVEAREEYEQLVEALIAEACEAGTVRDDLPVRRLALFLLNLLNWTIFWFRPDGELTTRQLADEMLDVFLHGAVDHRGLRSLIT